MNLGEVADSPWGGNSFVILWWNDHANAKR